MKNKNCELCNGTGWYGDNGPGIRGNREYVPCEHCNPKADGDYAVLGDGRALTQKDDEWMCITGTIWMKGDKLVITGCPKTEEHNCDAMGCGSLDHIILRATVTSNGI